jgi:aquaporin Z
MDSLKHGKSEFLKYCDEALGLGIFMFSAGFFDMLIEYPGLPFHQHLHSALLRRFLVGLSMGLTGLYIFTARFGKASGAYINPSITLVRYWLRDISLRDSFFYILFQLAGGAAGLYIVYILFPQKMSAPSVNYIVTMPGKTGTAVAFIAEMVISFLLIIVVLFTEKGKLAKYTSYFVSALITIYITFEAPYSGMSINPARTFSSAIVAGQWKVFWLYCIAPTIGMLLGGLIYKLSPKSRSIKIQQL